MIIDLEETNAFQEKGHAYPSITIIKTDKPSASFDYCKVSKLDELKDMQFSKRRMPAEGDWTTAFSVISINNAFKTIELQDFKIGDRCLDRS